MFRAEDIRRNVLLKSTRLCIETSCLRPLRGVNIAAGGLQKHMSSSFAIESLSSSSEGSQKSI